MKISEKQRTIISQLYLDIAESLPTFNGGFIADLQKVRKKWQNKNSLIDRKSHINDYSLDYSRLELVEIFQTEDFPKLLSGIEKLFPNLKLNRPGEEDYYNFKNTIYDHRRFSAQDIGVINKSGDKHPYLFTDNVAKIDTLPDEVKEIKVRIAKILPSIIIVIFSAKLTKTANISIQRILSKNVNISISFQNLNPLLASKKEFKIGSEDTVLSELCNSYLTSIQNNIEKSLKP
jgi:hypothetical protein